MEKLSGTHKTQPASTWLPLLLCALALGIVGMHGLPMHGMGGGESHSSHASSVTPGIHLSMVMPTSAVFSKAFEAQSPSPRTGAMALCIAILAGVGLGLMLLLVRRSARSCLALIPRFTLAPAPNTAPLVRPPDLGFSILRC